MELGLTTAEATGDDGVALTEMLGVELIERLTMTEATGADGVALTLAVALIEGVDD